jgi:hypothetical protein
MRISIGLAFLGLTLSLVSPMPAFAQSEQTWQQLGVTL